MKKEDTRFGCRPSLALPTLLIFLAACQSSASDDSAALLDDGAWRVIDSASGDPVSLAAMADALARADVVFLGEDHQNDVGHALQLETLRLLGERRADLILSLEMFEQDVQTDLTRYVQGGMSEEDFLAVARPWPNYEEHYRPAVEWCRLNGHPVLAANAPRKLAQMVSKEGIDAHLGHAWMPAEVQAPAGEYRERFEGAMADHPGLAPELLERFYQAQCVKDEAMAEAILSTLREARSAAGDQAPLVVHWCGKFHSDYRLGTVERLLRRAPDTEVMVATMVVAADGVSVTGETLDAADYIWWLDVRTTPD